jgi:hypothetical protein
MEPARPRAEEHALYGPRAGRPHAWAVTGEKGQEWEPGLVRNANGPVSASCQGVWAEIMFQP